MPTIVNSADDSFMHGTSLGTGPWYPRFAETEHYKMYRGGRGAAGAAGEGQDIPTAPAYHANVKMMEQRENGGHLCFISHAALSRL